MTKFKIFFDYKIYDNGTIYSEKTKKYLKHDITKCGYHQVTLYVNGKKIRKKVHRLVAYFFCNPPINYKELAVDHLDGDKSNNHFDNLEWVTTNENNKRARENMLNNISLSNSTRWNDDNFREKTSKNISNGRKKMGSSKGKNNPMFRYIIKDQSGNELDIKTLSKIIKTSYSTTYKLIKKYINTSVKDDKIKDFVIIDTKQ